MGSSALGSPAVKCVAAVLARWPPAEKPMIPMRSGSSFHSLALARTKRIAALGVAQLDGVVIFWPEAIAQHKRGDAVGCEPLADNRAFVLGEPAVAAAGADDEGCPAWLCRRRGGNLDDGDIGGLIAELAGRLVRPELDNLAVLKGGTVA